MQIFTSNKSGGLEENEDLLARTLVPQSTTQYTKLNINRSTNLRRTDLNELKLIISKLKPNKAPGIDRISNVLIKLIFKFDSSYLVDLYNHILKEAKIPKSWKFGKIIFFKKPSKSGSIPKDYRPITLISGWCKIAGALFANRIKESLIARKIFSRNQFGFREKTSTTDAIKQVQLIINNKVF